jgi:hypothetical protein
MLRFLGAHVILKGLKQSLKRQTLGKFDQNANAGHTVFYFHPIDISEEKRRRVEINLEYIWVCKAGWWNDGKDVSGLSTIKDILVSGSFLYRVRANPWIACFNLLFRYGHGWSIFTICGINGFVIDRWYSNDSAWIAG